MLALTLAADATTATTPGALVPSSPVALPATPVGTAILGTVIVLGVMFGVSALHGAWAYGDWTCAFKQCVAVAPVRRRRRKR